ncbi:MAG: type II CRISPR-associated endonuclease Cas1 [Bacteroidales bacterium]|nr:type II CRISPR-associated endonuclease Cas1 [Bacteroidales bacterium]
MIKRTIYIGKASYLKKKNEQMVLEYPDDENESKSVPIEDIGVVVLDNPQITITQGLLAALSENNAVIINCDLRHLPFSLMLPTAVHNAYTEKLRYQLGASVPLKKNLWQQTVIAKIDNQASLLEKLGLDSSRLHYLSANVKSDDVENCEGRAASYYWKVLFFDNDIFKRHRFGEPPNNLLNYGYAILRAVVARSLVASGLLTAMGIHHRNKYNPYCLADDIMEPFRPFVDERVVEIASKYEDLDELSPNIKKLLLEIPTLDITIGDQRSPLMVGLQRTTASLMQCFEGETRKLIYPILK